MKCQEVPSISNFLYFNTLIAVLQGKTVLCPATNIEIKMWMLCHVCGNIYSACLPWPGGHQSQHSADAQRGSSVISDVGRLSLRTLSAGQRVKVIRRAVTSLVICYSDCYKNKRGGGGWLQNPNRYISWKRDKTYLFYICCLLFPCFFST